LILSHIIDMYQEEDITSQSMEIIFSSPITDVDAESKVWFLRFVSF